MPPKVPGKAAKRSALIKANEVAAVDVKKSKLTESEIRFSLKIEYCTSLQVYKRKALALVQSLREKYGDIEVELNPSTPREGSFELTVTIDGKKDVTVWSGLNRGPPRKLKFPKADEVITEIEKLL